MATDIHSKGWSGSDTPSEMSNLNDAALQWKDVTIWETFDIFSNYINGY